METFEKSIVPPIHELEHKLLEGDAEKVEKIIMEIFLGNDKTIQDEINEKNAQYFRLLSVAYKEGGKFKKAEESTLTLLNYFIAENQNEYIADCYLNLAIIKRHISEYNESLKNLAIASNLFEELGLTYKIAKCQQTLGLIYCLLEYYEEAEVRVRNAQAFYEEAMIKYHENELLKKYIQLGLISCKHLLGVIIFDGGGKGDALTYLIDAKDESEKINRSRLRGYIYQDLSRYYLTPNHINTEIASEYLKKSEKIRSDLFDSKGIAICLLYEGILESTMVKWQKAIDYYLQALEKSTEIDALDIRIECFKRLFKAYTELDKKSEAISSIKNYLKLKQRESETKQTNKVELKKLIPINDRIKELNAELEKLRKVVNAGAEVSELIAPADAKSINRKPINAENIKKLSENRVLLKDENFENITDATLNSLEIIKNVLTEKIKTEYLLWRKDKENLLKPFYDKLIEYGAIDNIDYAKFKLIICDGYNDQKANYINWTKTHTPLAFLFLYLESKDILTKTFAITRYDCIASKFKKNNLDVTRALNTELSNVMASYKFSNELIMQENDVNAPYKKLVDEFLEFHK